MDGQIIGRGGSGASLSERGLMPVSGRTAERNSPLFDSQLSDRPSGPAVHGCHPRTVGFRQTLGTKRWRKIERGCVVSIAELLLVRPRSY